MQYSSRQEPRALVLRRSPNVAVGYIGPNVVDGEFTDFMFNKGIISIDPNRNTLNRARFRYAALASLGLSTPEIADTFQRSPINVGHTLSKVYQLTGVPSRSGLARHFLEEKTFKIVRQGDPIRLEGENLEIVERFSHGLNYLDIAQEFDVKPNTVMSRMSMVSERNDLNGIASIVMSALLSEQVGDFVRRSK